MKILRHGKVPCNLQNNCRSHGSMAEKRENANKLNDLNSTVKIYEEELSLLSARISSAFTGHTSWSHQVHSLLMVTIRARACQSRKQVKGDERNHRSSLAS